MSDFRAISGHEFDHTNTKSVDDKFHSVLGSHRLNNQSNSSFSSFEPRNKVDTNVCKLTHKSNTVRNFNAYIDALMYENFDIAVHSNVNDISVMLQQAVQYPEWSGWPKGASLQARLMSSNHGGGLKDTNIDTNLHVKHDSSYVGSVQPGSKNDGGDINSHHSNSYMSGDATTLCRVDFTQYHCYSGINYLYLVFVFHQNQDNNHWAFLEQVNNTQNFKIHACAGVPTGPIQIIESRFMYVDCHGDNVPYADGHTDPNIVYQNFKQDCHYCKLYGVTYEQYIVSIIDEMIDQPDSAEANVLECIDSDLSGVTNTNSQQPNTVDIGGANGLPLRIQGNFALAIEDDMGNSHSSDFAIATKTRGFLFQESGDFVFIGPDKKPINITTVNQCITIADLVRETNKPNYQQARFPVHSGLNLQAWDKYLQHYPHRIVLQYLKFGFPLSIEDPDALNNTTVTNHFSALQYPLAVQQYLDKEIALGAIVGPVDQVASTHFHCSPLLTRPKDGNKRRVILNLSYPYGNSLNDKVNKARFDGLQFILRFPSVDDIVAKILETPGDVYLSKIDVARAFRNLRVDPVDALKFGIQWQGKYFIDKGVAFGWVHGSSAFQMTSDAVTYIMKTKNHHMWAYIDDYILIGSKEATEAAFF